MGNASKPTRANRTITVDVQNATTSVQLRGDSTAFGACGLAFLLSRGFHRQHKATCRGGGRLTRHSHDVRVRLGGVTSWRLQCTRGKAGFTRLPHGVLCDRQMRPAVARDAPLAMHGGLRVERCAVISHISPLALYRLGCAFGHQRLGTVLPRGGLPRPPYVLADETHRHGLTDQGDRPTIVRGRVIGHLGSPENASATAWTQSYGEFQRAASRQEPTYRGRGLLTDGFDSPTRRMRVLFPGARLGDCLRHALIKRPGNLTARASPGRMTRRATLPTWLHRSRQRPG